MLCDALEVTHNKDILYTYDKNAFQAYALLCSILKAIGFPSVYLNFGISQSYLNHFSMNTLSVLSGISNTFTDF